MPEPTLESQPERTVRVTLVAWQALPAIVPSEGRNIGGLELGAWKLAKSLAQQPGFVVRIVVRSKGRTEDRMIDGVCVSMIGDRREGIRRSVSECIDIAGGFRIKRWAAKLLWQVPLLMFTRPWRTPDPEPMKLDPRLSKFDADAWIAFGSSRESAGVVATAIEKGTPSLLMLQSNADVDSNYAEKPEQRNQYGEVGLHCKFALDKSTKIACQTQWQADQLLQCFGREGILVPNSTDPQPWREAATPGGDYVLWVGRYDRFHKRPQLAIEIAKALPEIPFRMIVNASDDSVRQEIDAECPDNVERLDYVPFDQLPKQFGASRVFLSTGNAQYEGFPTVLLHAISARKPIVSLDDFSGFIQNSHSGHVASGSIKQASEMVRQYWNQPASWDHDYATRYLDENHTIDAVGKLLARIVCDMVSASTNPGVQR